MEDIIGKVIEEKLNKWSKEYPNSLKKEKDINKESTKVYCRDCEYFRIICSEISFNDRTDSVVCDHKSNNGNWYSKDGYGIHPSILNKNNQCRVFKKKTSVNEVDLPVRYQTNVNK